MEKKTIKTYQKTFIIAEAGVNHNGSIDRAIQMIHIAKEAGADAVKFQTSIPEDLVTADAKKAEYQYKHTSKNESQLEMLKRIHLPLDDYKILKQECEKKDIEFMSTPFDLKSLACLVELGMASYKIPSGEITNLPLIREISEVAKNVILSTGMSNLSEISDTIDVLVNGGISKNNISILHCNTEYPTPMKNVNLNSMLTLGEKFKVNIGLSDHTLGIEVPIAAVAMGATIIEKHFTTDQTLEGPDHKASLNPEELKSMITAIRNIEAAFGSRAKLPTEGELKNINIARKSIVASSNISKGEIFTSDNLTTKRPGNGISPMMWDSIVGEKSNKDYCENEMIKL
jgi:N,N'-diacetyllegionaminate synthase